MSAEPVPPDRRQRRRQETIAEVLDIAAEIMAEQGVVGLSLGEVARRLGVRPPSLYVYFPSKHALYDALFARGSQMLLDHLRAAEAGAEDSTDDGAGAVEADGRSLEEALLRAAELFVGWSVAHPAYTQLLFWRPVPGFAPSAEAYAPAVEVVELTRGAFTTLQQRGLVDPDAAIDDVFRDWTVLLSGVISQQLSNAPQETFATGRFTAALPGLVAMFAQHYGTATHTRPHGPATKETRHVRTR